MIKIFKSIVIVVVVIIFSAGCGNNNEQLDQDSDTLTGNDTLTLDSVTELSFDQCNAIIVGEGVRLRSEPGLKSEILDKLKTGDLVRKINTEGKRVKVGKTESTCDKYGYFWYEVITAKGVKGWVYGKFLYEIITNGKEAESYSSAMNEMIKKPLRVKNETWFIGFARDNSFPALGPDGLSGCDDFFMIFFYQKHKKQISPVKYLINEESGLYIQTTKEKDWMLFTSSDVIDDVIAEYIIEPDELYLNINRQYQDGDVNFDIYITYAKGVFEAIVIGDEEYEEDIEEIYEGYEEEI